MINMSDFRVSPDGLTPLLDDDSQSVPDASITNEDVPDIVRKSGFVLNDLYKLCLTFYKEFEGKAIHLTYKDKLKLVAYTKQISIGKLDTSKLPPPGYLDVVGNDRRKEWQALGDLSKEDCMLQFCELLDSRCPQLQPYIEAHRREKEEQERKRKEEEERRKQEEEERERQRLEEERQRKEEEARQAERLREEQQRLQFKESIYQQLEPQLRPLATEQYPQSPQQQQVFLQQLQEHYYQQYMQQVQQAQIQQQQQQQQQLLHNRIAASLKMENQTEGVPPQDGTTPNTLAQDLSHLELGDQGDAAPPNGDINNIPLNSDEEQYPVICKASCWTRKNFKEFKKELVSEKESVIKVGHGETVTVRVPTHQEGKYIFWEFATDSYDIGFGLYFEWTEAESNAISVHVSDSSEDEEEFEDEEGGGKSDIERGTKDRGPPMDEIIPIYRRDCHQEVYAGSHKYPGRGIYLLKFDNSYSLFRSKTLYYRVYYTRDSQPGRTPPDAVET